MIPVNSKLDMEEMGYVQAELRSMTRERIFAVEKNDAWEVQEKDG